MGIDVFVYGCKYFSGNTLMLSGWRHHIVNLSVYQFRPAAFRQVVDIMNGIDFFGANAGAMISLPFLVSVCGYIFVLPGKENSKM